MSEPLAPSEGEAVLHLFAKVGLPPVPAPPGGDRRLVSRPVDRRGDDIVAAVRKAQADGDQVITASLLGHKADVAVMGIGADWTRLRRLQTALEAAGLQ